MNVKNSKCIRSLAIKTLKKSSKRNIIAVAAIALTTLLFTSVFSVVSSLTATMELYNAKMAGCSAFGYFEALTEEDFQMIESDSRVTDYGYDLKVGTFDVDVFANKPLEICYMDDNCAKWCFVNLIEGNMPEEVDEVVVDRATLEFLNVPCEIGTEINIPFYLYSDVDRTNPQIATLKVVGISEENVLGKNHFVNVSKDFAKSYDYTTVMNVNIKGNSEDVIVDIFTDYNLFDKYQNATVDIFGIYSISGDSLLGGEGILIVGIFIFVLGFSGYLIIYNIFQISVVNDISYYGLLKTIGVTGKQLKKIIRIQALVLSAVGIPIGLVGGVIVGNLTAPQITQISNMSGISTVSSVSPWIFIGSSIVALITVFISCSKPGRIASKISPIEAFRFNEVKVDIKNGKKVSGLTGMAGRNLSRNKKKTVLVVISMALPLVILSLGLSVSNGMSFEDYYSSDYAFTVSNNAFFNYEIPETGVERVDDFVRDEDLTNIVNGFEIDRYGSAYTYDEPAYCDDYSVQLLAFDESLFDEIEVIEGDIQPLFNPDSNAIAITDSSYSENNYKVGDTITLSYRNQVLINSETGEKITDLNSVSADKIERGYEEYEKEYVICACISYSDDLWIRYSFGDSIELVLSKENLENDSNNRMYRYLSVFDTSDNAEVLNGEEFIKDYCAENNLNYSSEATERVEFKSFEDMFRNISVILTIVLTIIGILNFINAILTGILTRSHELAVMKAIGMTDKQQKKMLITEGEIYAGASVVLGALLYVLMFPMSIVLFEGLGYINPVLSFLPMCFIAVFFFIFGVVIPYVVYNNMAKKTVVERLKVTE